MKMENKKRLYIDFHVIQTVPPSCVNRDDTGRPKTAIYGGANRIRVSSQAWKHAIRCLFKENATQENYGIRTKNVIALLVNYLMKHGEEDNEKTIKKAVTALANVGIKVDEKENNATDVLFFISSKQIQNLGELILADEKDKKKYKEALREAPSIDMALFGRMVAEDTDLNIDAACQVAHCISTHAVKTEYDYFTAIDDFPLKENNGAGHLGTMEFGSATLYRYANINLINLADLIGCGVSNAVVNFTNAFIYSMPTGKQNSYANCTLPDLIYVTIREDRPINFLGAFESPIIGTDGFIEKSKKALFDYAEKTYKMYCGNPKYSFILGADDSEKEMNIVDFLTQLQEVLEKEGF